MGTSGRGWDDRTINIVVATPPAVDIAAHSWWYPINGSVDESATVQVSMHAVNVVVATIRCVVEVLAYVVPCLRVLPIQDVGNKRLAAKKRNDFSTDFTKKALSRRPLDDLNSKTCRTYMQKSNK